MVQMISDEVWRQLDPYAGQLAPRTVRRTQVTAVAVVALCLAAAAVWWSGVIVPRLAWPADSGSGSSVSRDLATHEVNIVNRGVIPVEVVGVGRSGAGMQLVEVQALLPKTLAPGQSMRAVLVYRVTDCAAVTSAAWPVPVRVKRPWGTSTGYVAVPTHISDAAPEGMRTYQGRDPYAVEWQRALADGSCAIRER